MPIKGTKRELVLPHCYPLLLQIARTFFTVTVEDNQENTKNVTNPQAEIDAFIDAVNADPLHNIPKVYISGVVISFAQLEINEDEINSTVEMAGGHYVLTLSKTPDSSLIIYTANA